MTDPGHTPAEGYAASLRRHAEWLEHYYPLIGADPPGMKAAAAFIEQQAARIAELENALQSAIRVAGEARQEWDAAPSGMKAGKLLIALSDARLRYRDDITAIHAILALTVPTEQNKGEKK